MRSFEKIADGMLKSSTLGAMLMPGFGYIYEIRDISDNLSLEDLADYIFMLDKIPSVKNIVKERFLLDAFCHRVCCEDDIGILVNLYEN